MEIYLKIAQLFLEDDDAVQAEIYINRATLLPKLEVQNEKLHILYKVKSPVVAVQSGIDVCELRFRVLQTLVTCINLVKYVRLNMLAPFCTRPKCHSVLV